MNVIDEIKNVKFAQNCIIGVVIVAVLIAIFNSILSGVITILSFVFGVFVFLLISYITAIINYKLLPSKLRRSKGIKYKNKKHCIICRSYSCIVHKPSNNFYNNQTYLPEPVDAALQSLLEEILELYINKWHHRLSDDPDFEYNLRIIIQTSINNLLNRISKLDENKIITGRLLPIIIQHVECIMQDKNFISTTNQKVPERINYDKLNIKWHPAISSRTKEILYLRKLSEEILPHLLPTFHLNCSIWSNLTREIIARWLLLPAMDVLGDSTILLRLLINSLEYSNYKIINKNYKNVPTLQLFVTSKNNQKRSALHVGLTEIIKDTKLLYHFMQFLKKENAVHVLQFCLDLDKFNEKILNPDINEKDKCELYEEAWDIFSLYFKPNSPDFVGFPDEFIVELKKVLDQGNENIIRLRNTPALFQASEWAYNLLEEKYLPRFHHSEDFFIMLYKGRLGKIKSNTTHKRHKSDDVISINWLQNEFESNESLTSTDSSTSIHNLNAWRISVPRVYLRPEYAGSSKITAVMIISVQRIDVNEFDDPDNCRWNVYRTYADFCALASQLLEFHGEFQQSFNNYMKRPVLHKGLEALEEWKAEGEEYLKRLLYTPTLQRSDLLHAFLSPDIQDFALEVGNAELSISKVLRNVRIRKENGQHLEFFISNLLSSCQKIETNEKLETTNINKQQVTKISKKERRKIDLFSPIYGNNLNQKQNLKDKYSNISTGSQKLNGIFDLLLYIVTKLVNMSNSGLLYIIFGIKKLFKPIINYYLEKKLEKGLVLALNPDRLVFLMNAIKDELNGDKINRDVFNENENKYTRILLHLLQEKTWPISTLINSNNGLFNFVSIVRTPTLNKQLAYLCLDVIVEELIPEIMNVNSNK